jgi:hypothetical protein
MKDPIRKAHYTQRLAQLTDKEVRTVEAALAQMSGAVKTRQTVRKQPPSAVKPVSSSRTEEDCLALLLRHPELRNRNVRPLPEYFGNSENREIYIAWQQAEDIESLKERLDPALHEHLEGLVGRNILATEIDARYNDYVLRLQEDYLKSVARKRASLAGADPAVRELPGEKEMEVSTGLREIFSEKAKRSRGQRRN